MNCPVDGTLLSISERSGIEIDWCPTCRGVWLDRGELDRLIERAGTTLAPPPPEEWQRATRPPRYDDDDKRWDHRYDRDMYKHKGKRKKNLLSELFDFD